MVKRNTGITEQERLQNEFTAFITTSLTRQRISYLKREDRRKRHTFDMDDEMFEEMTEGIRENTAKTLIRTQVGVKHQIMDTTKPTIIIDNTSAARAINKEKPVGRNEKCPCGSGRKYKNCCGKNL